jgi:putative transposase
MDYRYGSHTVFQIEYHFVWVTKYRYKILIGEIAERVRTMVRQVCETVEIRIVSGLVSKDHVHILVSAPPSMAPSEIMRRIKGNTVSRLFEEFPHLKKRYWGDIFGREVISALQFGRCQWCKEELGETLQSKKKTAYSEVKKGTKTGFIYNFEN